nr:hypothetical protein CFP56_40550 [Quercus suber]
MSWTSSLRLRIRCSSPVLPRKRYLGLISIWYNTSLPECLPWPYIWWLNMLAMIWEKWKQYIHKIWKYGYKYLNIDQSTFISKIVAPGQLYCKIYAALKLSLCEAVSKAISVQLE